MTSLGSILRRRAVRVVAFIVGAGVTATAMPLFMHGDQQTVSNAHTQTRVERLIDAHDCWSGEGPVGVIPGRAVVTLPGQRARMVKADVGFGIWLDGDPGTLHAFCR